MGKIYSDVTQLIGKTPIVSLNKIEKALNLDVHLFAKLEYFNPAGSAKDRVALEMINSLIEKNIINSDTVLIAPTSGNTGIGLASVCGSMNIKLIIVMPENMSDERKKLMSAYGAELVLTDASLGMGGACEKAEELNESIPYSLILDQFKNPSNALAHYKTSGPEIYEDMDGNIDIFVAGIGSGGTISGISKYLKEKNSKIITYGIEPASSPFLSRGISGEHRIQGIGAGFKPDILDMDVVDCVYPVTNEDAFSMAKIVAKKEGILVGISSGAALSCAVDIGRRPENKGKNIVVVFPDTGEHYLSTPFFIDL